ncbi:MAG: N-acetylmuramoyl-L-alanine amidase [Patescibacteria group bacterium]|nr:peptidoglycan recognition protein family protein [Patescibacteria group bacterium]MDE1940906.1 N-acetylmuramoyl-L-alanine amidase [Patescibacteria group bacterium]MDE1966911.1 N-acetylmuramoyl-L-alanine amidase [Patescibacteria group bacterium]
MIFDPETWSEKIRDPHWYMAVPAVMADLSKLHDIDRAAYEETKDRIYAFFEEKLAAGEVALGADGKDFDAERLPIDMAVIHHTSNPPGMSKDRLSAIELVRLYAPQYAKPTYDADREVKGAPIYSGHFREEGGKRRQVFWPYHWFVRKNGEVERLLNDDEIGWHAGDWEINRRSVAIAFDDDYEDSEPTAVEIEAAARILREHYPQIKPEHIFGHCEVNEKRTCPGKLFLSVWKQKLLDARMKRDD